VVFAPPGRRARAVVNAILFVALTAVLPALYLVWSRVKTGDPFFFARYIAADHANAARQTAERLGGALARVRQLGIWAVSFAAAMTPVLFFACVPAVRRWRQWGLATCAVVVTTWAPIGLYLGRGLLFGAFEPLARFALVPGAVLLPLAADALLHPTREDARRDPGLSRPAVAPARGWRRAPAAVAAAAVALSVVALALTFGGPGRVWTGGESISPLTRLDGEDRALAHHLDEHRRRGEGVFIDTFGFADITIAHAARVPAPRVATLAQTRDLGPSFADARRRSGATWFALYDDSWGRKPIPDWPADTRRFGHWRLAHVGDDAGRRRLP